MNITCENCGNSIDIEKNNKCKETSIDEDSLLYINKNRTKSSNIKLLVVLILIVSLLILSKIFII